MIVSIGVLKIVIQEIEQDGGDMQVFIINLASAGERRIFQQQQMQRLSLCYQLLQATSVDDIPADTYQKHSLDWQRPLRKTEVACYFSHRDAWERVIQINQPALILEDDALLSKCVPELLAALESREDADLINLEVRGRMKFVSKTSEKITADSRLYRLYQDRAGAAGYIIWPSGARKLLEYEQKKGIALADAHITACSEMIAYQVEPAAIVQFDHGGQYGINIDRSDNIFVSTVSAANNDKGGINFRFKRMLFQLKLGLRQLILITYAKRRYIKLKEDDFLQ